MRKPYWLSDARVDEMIAKGLRRISCNYVFHLCLDGAETIHEQISLQKIFDYAGIDMDGHFSLVGLKNSEVRYKFTSNERRIKWLESLRGTEVIGLAKDLEFFEYELEEITVVDLVVFDDLEKTQ